MTLKIDILIKKNIYTLKYSADVLEGNGSRISLKL